MRKKKCLDYPAPEGNVVLHGHNVGHERHQLLDIRDYRGHVYRCILTKDNFITWDYIDEKWIKRDADDLDYSDAGMTREEKKIITQFARKERKIRAKRSAEKEKKEEQQKKEDFAMLPPEPKHLNDWLERTFPKYLYYKKKGSKARVMCPCCGAEYEFRFAGRWKSGEEPRKDQRGTCRTCGRKGFWQPWGKVKNRRFYRYFWILQAMPDGRLLARMYFYNWISYGGYKDQISCDEELRIIMEPGKVTRYYHIYSYFQESCFWSPRNIGGYGNISPQAGEIYPAWQQEIERSSMKYCDITEWRKILPCWRSESQNIIYALITHANYPQTEILLKTGAERLARQLGEGYRMRLNRRGKRPDEFLRLDMPRAKELIRENGDSRLLELLQFEMAAGAHWNEQERKVAGYLMTIMTWKELMDLTGIMSITKITNRAEKYKCEFGNSVMQTARELTDYLEIRKSLGYDMTNSVYLNPRSLREAHADMIEERERRRTDRFIEKKMAEYPRIRSNYPRLRRKYTWSHDGLSIRPAKDAEEIIMEGRIQHHCVGGDMYLRKHDRGESVILLLRDDESPNMPYITVEIRGEAIVQWYGAHDRKPDKEKIGLWLKEYTDRFEKAKPAAGTAAQALLEMA